MGGGSYTSSDWKRMRASRNITSNSSADDLFKNRTLQDKYNPKLIPMRESRDGEDHPNSTPIIIGLDVTGSMGYLSEEIAKNGLNEVMQKIYSTHPVEDPQIMFAAFGDYHDDAPLQVTQFESDIRIAEQLMDLWLENGGQGLIATNYLWRFAADRTHTDNFEKRGRKGFLFTIGDADCRGRISGEDFNEVLGGNYITELATKTVADVSEKYELFHIHLINYWDNGVSEMTRAIPGRVIYLDKENVSKIPDIIIAVMEKVNGKSDNEIFNGMDPLTEPIVRDAMAKLNFAEVLEF